MPPPSFFVFVPRAHVLLSWVDAVDDVEEELPTKTDGSILSSQNGLQNQLEHKSKVEPWYKSAWNLIFSNQFETQQKLKPAVCLSTPSPPPFPTTQKILNLEFRLLWFFPFAKTDDSLP